MVEELPVEELAVDDTTRIRREGHRQVRDRAALHAILDEALVAHVGVVRDGTPLVLPFACARDGDTVVLHGSTASGLLRVATGDAVCVTVTHLDGLVFARTGEERAAALTLLSEHLFPGRTSELREPTTKEVAATMVLRVPLDRVSVKVAEGPPEVDPDDHEPRSVWAGVVPLRLAAEDPISAPDVPAEVPVPLSVHRTIRARDRDPSR
jgi:nitroimidazol reductase NimA-like FMN-containing flavoprotein (pyridoxamine 5'-phosphate oxidase superfamily)